LRLIQLTVLVSLVQLLSFEQRHSCSSHVVLLYLPMFLFLEKVVWFLLVDPCFTNRFVLSIFLFSFLII
jgi:hypothetical protein